MNIDRNRLRRALALQVSPGGPGKYQVEGGSARHEVRCAGPGEYRCDCPDAQFLTSGRCKHVLAVYLTRRVNSDVLDAIRDLVHPARNLASRPPSQRLA